MSSLLFFALKLDLIGLHRHSYIYSKVHLEKGWNSKRMIIEGEAAILLETTRRAFRNQQQSKQR